MKPAQTFVVASILSSLLAFAPSQSSACLVFAEPDDVYWSDQATVIVDATVSGFDRQLLTNSEATDVSFQGADTWVLVLNVHTTLRGDEIDVRLVATRFFNTTIVDEMYLLDLVGKRKEFALVSHPGTIPATVNVRSLGPDFPLHDGFHVRDRDGKPIDEMWEGLCVALPIFDLGTFGR